MGSRLQRNNTHCTFPNYLAGFLPGDCVPSSRSYGCLLIPSRGVHPKLMWRATVISFVFLPTPLRNHHVQTLASWSSPYSPPNSANANKFPTSRSTSSWPAPATNATTTSYPTGIQTHILPQQHMEMEKHKGRLQGLATKGLPANYKCCQPQLPAAMCNWDKSNDLPHVWSMFKSELAGDQNPYPGRHRVSMHIPVNTGGEGASS